MKSNNGHRARLRERFFKSGLKGFLDYEVLELLLIFGTPRKDCKQIAKSLILKHKSLENVLNLSQDELQQVVGIGSINSILIRLYNEVKKMVSEQKLQTRRSLKSTKEIVEYLRNKIGNEKKEHFVILCLDSKDNIVYDDVSVGILNASLVHPREVFSKAILYHANQIILAHNHPSGDTSPSADDIQTSIRLLEAGRILGIKILMQLIISNVSYNII